MLASESLLNCDGLASASAAHQKTVEVLGVELLQNEHVSSVTPLASENRGASRNVGCGDIQLLRILCVC